MGSVWVIADTHFNHEDLERLDGRPRDCDDRIKRNWKAKVGAQDLVLCLGDMIWNRQGELGEILDDLPGRKVLIRGNHDNQKDLWYIKKGFVLVCDTFSLAGVLFSHEPFLPVLRDKFSINLHGHLHGEHSWRMARIHDKLDGYDPGWHKLISIEDAFCPVCIDNIGERDV